MSDTMEQTEIESRIRNTTSMVNDGDIDADQSFTGTCSICDSTFTCNSLCCNEALLKRCSSCMGELEENLDNVIDNLGTTQEANRLGNSGISELVDFEEQQSNELMLNSNLPPPSLESSLAPLTIEAIEVLIMLAANDLNKKFNIILNGKYEEFSLIYDPVNRLSTRKVCIKYSNAKKDLYWYKYVGILSGINTKTRKGPRMLVSGATVSIKGMDDSFVLSDILETMCHKPRYDGLVYNLKTKEVSILKGIQRMVTTIDFETTYDSEEVERYLNYFIDT
jgi:hypothetical protein